MQITVKLGLATIVLGAALAPLAPVAAAWGETPAIHGPGRGVDPIDLEQARREVLALLASLERAVLAADVDAYMALVDTADTEFVHEQRYFANDFKRATPAAFATELGDLTQHPGEVPAVRGKLTLRWTMPERQPRQVSFDVSFVRRADGWRYAGEIWETLEAPAGKGTVIVMVEPGLDQTGEVARTIAQAFGEVREHVETGFQLENSALASRPIKIKLYRSMRHLQASICLAYEDPLGGWNEPGESIKILASRRATRDSLRPLLAHEYGHVNTFELGAKATKMPWWVLEGVAELAAEKFNDEGRNARAFARAQAASGGLAPWDQITDFHATPDQFQGHVYSQGHAMLGYVSERFGRDRRNAWLAAMAQGQTLDEASRSALDQPFDEVDRAWRESLTAPPSPAPQHGEPDKNR